LLQFPEEEGLPVDFSFSHFEFALEIPNPPLPLNHQHLLPPNLFFQLHHLPRPLSILHLLPSQFILQPRITTPQIIQLAQLQLVPALKVGEFVLVVGELPLVIAAALFAKVGA
jgi:hypothetical protein